MQRRPSSGGPTQRTGGSLSRRRERQLIRRAQSGCAPSARELIEAHQQRLFSFIGRMVGDYHEAEEIAQEAMLRAFKTLDQFNSEYRFSTYLFTIAYRLCLNWLRRRGGPAGRVSLAGEHTLEWTDPSESAEHVVAQSEEARRLKQTVWDAVDRLTGPQRAAALLFYREQMNCQQIAEALEMPASTVKSHLHRARGRLREMLAAELGSELERFGFERKADIA